MEYGDIESCTSVPLHKGVLHRCYLNGLTRLEALFHCSFAHRVHYIFHESSQRQNMYWLCHNIIVISSILTFQSAENFTLWFFVLLQYKLAFRFNHSSLSVWRQLKSTIDHWRMHWILQKLFINWKYSITQWCSKLVTWLFHVTKKHSSEHSQSYTHVETRTKAKYHCCLSQFII